jgi:membrane protease YdiL (CAAX protease family)
MVSTSSGRSSQLSGTTFVALVVLGEAGLLLLGWGLGRWLRVSPAGRLDAGVGSMVWGILAAVPLLLALGWMLNTTFPPIRGLVRLVEEQIGPLLAGCTTADLLVMAAAAAVCEEVLFRGVIQVGLNRVIHPVLSLVIASAAFGLVHCASKAYAVLAGLMGMYLGAVFLLQGSLTAPIVAHGVYDFVALTRLARRAGATSGEA